ncbi:MAG TPA: hypothetical protein VLF41_03540 [Candidatus Nanoarchaeia archaeon]|nr:hypothetical protein [Candidatus Nanoarchaeia archaeon]
MRYLDQENGMTFVEIIIAVTLAAIIVTILAQFYSNALLDYGRTETKTQLQQNTRQAVDTLARDIKAAISVESPNHWPDSHSPTSPSNNYGWQSTSGSSATLVMAVPSRDTNDGLLYIDSLHNALQTDDVVYYINSANKILYRRVIANPVAGNAALTSCPPGQTSSSCPADANVVEDVADLTITYFDLNNNVTTPTNSVLLEITLKQTRVRNGRTLTSSYTTRVGLRNK